MKKILTIALIASVYGCGSNEKKTMSDLNNLQQKWELTILDGKNIDEKQSIYIELSQDSSITGYLGCNYLNGKYFVEKDKLIHFTALSTSRMACPDLELEYQIIEMLKTADNFTIDNDKLMLHVGRRAPLAVFTKMQQHEMVNKYWKLKTLDNKPVVMDEKQEREQYFILKSDNTITGFAGCNYFNGHYELGEENTIHFDDNMAVSMKICPNITVDEGAFLRVFDKVGYYTINGETLILRSEDKTPLAEFESIHFN